MKFFDFGLILASVVCVGGILRRMAKQGASPTMTSPSLRHGFLRAAKALLLDILLLRRTARSSLLRWGAHSLVFVGFMGLLLFHAFDGTITAYFFPAYEPTLDPWQFLRNLFGVMVLVGLALMLFRRVRDRKLLALTRFQDWAAILVVGGIILSGFLLEASKIMSPAVFDDMVDEYAVAEGDDITALKAVWSEQYGVVFSAPIPITPELLEQGMAVDEDSCTDCHSNTSSAFVSRPLASALEPLAPAMNRSRADVVFWYVHILFCFVGLAALPFGKFFHILSTPANLLSGNGNIGLHACTRCGECSLHCSVAPAFDALGNPDILPSEKLMTLRAFAAGQLSGLELEAFAEGSRICTECRRCADLCPSGIDLQQLWLTSKAAVGAVVPDPNRAIRAMSVEERTRLGGGALPPVNGLADHAESFHGCVQCTTCTSVCPVVAVCEDPSRDLDLLPQQVMNLLRMGLKEETLGARMVWSCTTCYKCQEHCPQNIRVADVLYELRNTAAARMRVDRIGKGE